ncbi:hypothetical protein AB0M46_35785 [Dactylosporangium sp. NPDC051485]
MIGHRESRLAALAARRRAVLSAGVSSWLLSGLAESSGRLRD